MENKNKKKIFISLHGTNLNKKIIKIKMKLQLIPQRNSTKKNDDNNICNNSIPRPFNNQSKDNINASNILNTM